jgi:phage terminase Nu1 subunit (DNA packaging protein)
LILESGKKHYEDEITAIEIKKLTYENRKTYALKQINLKIKRVNLFFWQGRAVQASLRLSNALSVLQAVASKYYPYMQNYFYYRC